jgi:hypothetical protein
VNGTVLVTPIGVVMLTVLAVSEALAEIVKVALTVVLFTTERPPTVMPPPETVIAVEPVRPTPVSVTGTTLPRAPDVGAIEASDGPVIVNVSPLLVPPAVVTVTDLAVSAAPGEITKLAETVVALTAVKLLTVTPEPDTPTDCVPNRLVPVRVTATVVPRTPVVGAIAVSVGGSVFPWYSTAPTSNLLVTAASNLLLPKKSNCCVGQFVVE